MLKKIKDRKVRKCVSPTLGLQSQFPESHLAIVYHSLFYRLSHTHTHTMTMNIPFIFYSRQSIFLFTCKILSFFLLVRASSPAFLCLSVEYSLAFEYHISLAHPSFCAIRLFYSLLSQGYTLLNILS